MFYSDWKHKAMHNSLISHCLISSMYTMHGTLYEYYKMNEYYKYYNQVVPECYALIKLPGPALTVRGIMLETFTSRIKVSNFAEMFILGYLLRKNMTSREIQTLTLAGLTLNYK